jgi:hypothetical protein
MREGLTEVIKVRRALESVEARSGKMDAGANLDAGARAGSRVSLRFRCLR